jgi:uncharacterized protein YabN with tetrapyrrole methylase and pyrophosphatase domain
MNASNRLPYDIALVGLGIVGTHQITREAEETVRRCTQTFVIDPTIGVVTHLRTLCPKVTNLMSTYVSGAHRKVIYRKMASMVVAAAMEKPPVCFATYGHPKIFCHPAVLIQRAARVLDLKTGVISGVSSLDALFAEVNVDPGFDGLQVYDATDLVVRRRPLQTDVSCVILQPGTAMEPYERPGPPNIDNLRILQNYLLEFYPADHGAILVISKTHPLLESIKQKVPMGKLATALQQSSNVATLLIPPVHHREVADQKLANKLRAPAAASDQTAQGVARRPGRPPIGPKSA